SIVAVDEREQTEKTEEHHEKDEAILVLKEENVTQREMELIPRQAFRAQRAENFPQQETEELVDVLLEFSSCFALKNCGLGCRKEGKVNHTKTSRRNAGETSDQTIQQPLGSASGSGKEKGRQLEILCLLPSSKCYFGKGCVDPLPRIEETLSRMGNACIFSTMDLESGYWQVPMHEEHKAKTAFVTPDGLYQFLVMPFGLASAPGTIQRMMDLVLSGLRWTICLVYLDDIIIYAGSANEQLVRIRQVLTALHN
ncbi:Uncharacterized protein APZ42_010701, partial [Daphnia magna]